MEQFKVSTFSISKRHRSIIACLSCRKKHIKCIIENGQTSCRACLNNNNDCIWDSTKPNKENKNCNKLDILEKEKVYQQLFLDNNYSNQFVCATQPLSLLLSKDSFLCFDGDNFGLYYPWRGINGNSTTVNELIDSDLKKYLDVKGAFSVPPINEQRRLLQIFLDNLYPLYPIVKRDIINDIRAIPLLLLNAIFLVSARFDTQLAKDEIRLRAQELFERCKLLELTEKNKITLIQTYILISFHEEGMDGSNTSKDYITKACNLCGELAMTNISGKNGIMNNRSVDLEKSPFKKIQYDRRFLERLFWTSYCCDRLISATSGREMYYNTADMMVDPITLDDFEVGEFQASDFETFSSYLSICKLIERIQATCYRPPENRTVDDRALEMDLIYWKENNLSNCQPKLQGFLRIAHAYACILYFRCFIDAISLITKDFCLDNDNESKAKCLQYIDNYSMAILDIVQSASYVNHIVVVHAVLHTVALAQVQIKTAGASSSNIYYEDMGKRSIAIINDLRQLWWLAGSAYYLCKEVMPKQC